MGEAVPAPIQLPCRPSPASFSSCAFAAEKHHLFSARYGVRAEWAAGTARTESPVKQVDHCVKSARAGNFTAIPGNTPRPVRCCAMTRRPGGQLRTWRPVAAPVSPALPAAQVHIAFHPGKTVPQCEMNCGFESLWIGRTPQRPVRPYATTRHPADPFPTRAPAAAARATAQVRIAFHPSETAPQCEKNCGFENLWIGRTPQRPVRPYATTRRPADPFLTRAPAAAAPPGAARAAAQVRIGLPPQRDRAAVRDELRLRESLDRADSATAGETLRYDLTAGGSVPSTSERRRPLLARHDSPPSARRGLSQQPLKRGPSGR
jgi:hypothetical protein